MLIKFFSIFFKDPEKLFQVAFSSSNFFTVDFDKQANKLIETKSEWHLMPFKEQSDYKCESVGLSSERFNDVIWE